MDVRSLNPDEQREGTSAVVLLRGRNFLSIFELDEPAAAEFRGLNSLTIRSDPEDIHERLSNLCSKYPPGQTNLMKKRYKVG